MMQLKATRDLVAVATASTDLSIDAMTGILLGDTAVADRKFFEQAIEMLFHCAHYTHGVGFANILSVLGWGCWTHGRGSEAQHFLRRAQAEQPGHELSILLLKLINTGKIPATAVIDPRS